MSDRVILAKYNHKKLQWLHGAVFFVVLILLLTAILLLFIGLSRVSGQSMSPTYKDGSVVFYQRHCDSYSAGDVIAIRMASGEQYIKRVIAGPGDTVDLRDGVLYVNGIAENSDCAHGRTEPEVSTVKFPYTVEAGRYFVLGDNRENSVDSRTFGTVSTAQILGRVLN